MTVIYNLSKFVKGHNEVFVASEGFLGISLNRDYRLLIGTFLVPGTGAFAPVDDEFIFVFRENVYMFQCVKGVVSAEHLWDRISGRHHVRGIGNGAADLIAPGKPGMGALITDEYTPVIVILAECDALILRVLQNHIFIVAFFEGFV
jgi:hypothetical protein